MTETVPHAVAHSGSYTIAIATRVQYLMTETVAHSGSYTIAIATRVQ